MACTCNSIAHSPLWPEMELVHDFMPVLVVCKFDEDPIKIGGAIVSIIFFQCLRAGNSKGNGQMWPEFELV